MKLAIFTAIVLATAALVGCGNTDAKPKHVTPIAPAYDATVLAGQAKSEVTAIGTLATIGSFEWGSAPLATLAAASLKHVPQLLHDHQLTVDEAQGMINAAVKVRDLLKAANAACAQNNATGKCTGDQTRAESLADKAKAAMVTGCLNLNDGEILKCLHR